MRRLRSRMNISSIKFQITNKSEIRIPNSEIMRRRTFIKKATLATAGMLTVPYILPTGRLFAGIGDRVVNHVVFVLFAGGVRHQESVDMSYLTAQGIPSSGNLMENILNGAAPSSNI